MRKIGWYRRKKQKKFLILGSLFLLLFLCVGYAAFSTQLSLRAKGNIKPKKTADILKENVVESGDGLYKDIYEDGRYIYKGANPNNYITFNNETWRIISVEEDGSIKIMKNESIGSLEWDGSDSNNWARPSSLNTYLNNEYLQTLTDLDKVISYHFSIGIVENDNNDLAAQINSENGVIWNGKIGLITLSEYIRANSNVNMCGTDYLIENIYNMCFATNWIYDIIASDNGLWTISTTENNGVIYISSHNGITGPLIPEDNFYGVLPTLYLSPDITLSGSGSKEEPYSIVN